MSENQQQNRGKTLARQVNELIDIGFGDVDQDTRYMARLMMQAVIPHKETDAREVGIVNGGWKIGIQAGYEEKLPSGSYPRLLLIWVIAEAIRTKSRNIYLGDSLAAFMEKLDIVPSGGRWGSITRLRTQARRLFNARVSFIYDGKEGYGSKNVQFADTVRMFWTNDNFNQGDLEGHSITLSEPFFKEIMKRPYPFDMNILRGLTRSPLGIDLYVWLTYRVSYLKEPVSISWKQLREQFGSNYGDDKAGQDGFTRAAKRELKKINAAWPGLNYETPRGRLALHPCHPSIEKTKEPGR